MLTNWLRLRALERVDEDDEQQLEALRNRMAQERLKYEQVLHGGTDGLYFLLLGSHSGQWKLLSDDASQ